MVDTKTDQNPAPREIGTMEWTEEGLPELRAIMNRIAAQFQSDSEQQSPLDTSIRDLNKPENE